MVLGVVLLGSGVWRGGVGVVADDGGPCVIAEDMTTHDCPKAVQIRW